MVDTFKAMIPGELIPAFATRRPELVALVERRPLTIEEADVLYKLIAALIGDSYQHEQEIKRYKSTLDKTLDWLNRISDNAEAASNGAHRAQALLQRFTENELGVAEVNPNPVNERCPKCGSHIYTWGDVLPGQTEPLKGTPDMRLRSHLSCTDMSCGWTTKGL